MKPFILVAVLGIAVSFFTITPLISHGQSSFVNSPDGIRIAYEVRGEGNPTLLFVHGWSCDRNYWKGQLEPFSKQFKVVAIDLAGHGESGLGRAAWTIESFAADVAAVIEQLGSKRVILIGHCLGGDVIAEAARHLKGRVAGLVMVDVYKELGQGRSPEEVQAFVSRLRTNFHDSVRALVRSMFLTSSDSSLVERVADDISSASPEIALNVAEHALSYSRKMPNTLMELKLPTIAINPDNTAH